jgi:hypothetical protein
MTQRRIALVVFPKKRSKKPSSKSPSSPPNTSTRRRALKCSLESFQRLTELREVNPEAASFFDYSIQIVHARDVGDLHNVDVAAALASQMTWRRVKATKMTG